MMRETLDVVMPRAGIRIELALLTAKEGGRTAGCGGGFAMGENLIRIVALRPLTYGKSADSVGLAVRGSGLATLHYAKISRISEQWYVERGRLLGYVTAHEIGHLLLGPEHNWCRIMVPLWSADDLQAMRRLCLSFSNSEIQRLMGRLRP